MRLRFLGLVLLSLACGDNAAVGTDPVDLVPDVPTGTTVADLAGSWTASAHTFTTNDSSETYDLIANGGETRFTLFADGRVRTWAEYGSFSDEWDALLTINGSTMTSVPAETTRETLVWTFTYDGTTLTLTDVVSEFDFTLTDITPVAAMEVVIFGRH